MFDEEEPFACCRSPSTQIYTGKAGKAWQSNKIHYTIPINQQDFTSQPDFVQFNQTLPVLSSSGIASPEKGSYLQLGR